MYIHTIWQDENVCGTALWAATNKKNPLIRAKDLCQRVRLGNYLFLTPNSNENYRVPVLVKLHKHGTFQLVPHGDGFNGSASQIFATCDSERDCNCYQQACHLLLITYFLITYLLAYSLTYFLPSLLITYLGMDNYNSSFYFLNLTFWCIKFWSIWLNVLFM